MDVEPVTEWAAATPPSARRLRVDVGLIDQVGEAYVVQALASGTKPFHRCGKQPGAVADPASLMPADGVTVFDSLAEGCRTIVVELPGTLILVTARREVTHVDVVGEDLETVTAHLDELLLALQQSVERHPDQVRMRLWSHRGDYAEMSTRQVSAPSWAEVADNYARPTADALQPLVSATQLDGRAGRLVLWHGAPGTGKTTAVRALSQEWSSWCDTHYVADPEKLFADPGYLLEVAGVDGGEESRQDGKPWRLIVAEDCDEYLQTDAKQRAGASLGRLLNLCDGILGHGLRVVVLLTTNEDVGRLHPAITRPGRCLNQVQFLPLSPEAGGRWLGPDTSPPTRPMTLAELFAVREQRAAGAVVPDESGGYL